MVDDPRSENRRALLKRKSEIKYTRLWLRAASFCFKYDINNFRVASFADPLKKREEFSVSLRKKKKQEIIQSKRKRAEWNGGSA